jgi:hypothetical protein
MVGAHQHVKQKLGVLQRMQRSRYQQQCECWYSQQVVKAAGVGADQHVQQELGVLQRMQRIVSTGTRVLVHVYIEEASS